MFLGEIKVSILSTDQKKGTDNEQETRAKEKPQSKVINFELT